jgi:hypothetical protein
VAKSRWLRIQSVNRVFARTLILEQHLGEVDTWMDSKSYIKTLRVSNDGVLRAVETIAKKVTQFLGVPLDIEAMTRQADATLYGNRSERIVGLHQAASDHPSGD